MGAVEDRLQFGQSPDGKICAMESQIGKSPHIEINDINVAATPDRVGGYLFLDPRNLARSHT